VRIVKKATPALTPHGQRWTHGAAIVQDKVAALTSLNVSQTSPGLTVRDFQPIAEVET